MEDKDEDALKAVEDCEDVSHNDRMSVDVEETKRPRRTEQYYQHYRTFDPRPAKQSLHLLQSCWKNK